VLTVAWMTLGASSSRALRSPGAAHSGGSAQIQPRSFMFCANPCVVAPLVARPPDHEARQPSWAVASSQVLGRVRSGAVVPRRGARPEECFVWATHLGAELAYLVARGSFRFGFEFKRTTAPVITRSMRMAVKDLRLAEIGVLHAGSRSCDLGENIRAIAPGRILEDVNLSDRAPTAGDRDCHHGPAPHVSARLSPAGARRAIQWPTPCASR